MKRLSDAWIFENHDKDTLSRWVSSLKLFRFVRAWGGHANDGDQFILLIDYNGIEELKSALHELGAELRTIPEGYPRPVPGVSYKWEEYRKFKNEIYEHPGYEQPGKVYLLNREVYVFIRDELIQIQVRDIENPYIVTEDTFQYCMKLEDYLLQCKSLTFSKANDNKANYLSEVLYPELFN